MGLRHHLDTKSLQMMQGSGGNIFRKRGKELGAGLNQRDTDTRGQIMCAICDGCFSQLHKFGSQLDAGCAPSNNANGQLSILREALQNAKADFLIEGLGLLPGIYSPAPGRNASRGEVIGLATQRNYKSVVPQGTFRDQQASIGRMECRKLYLMRIPIQSTDLARLERKARIVRLGEIRGLLLGNISGSGRDGVQHRLPYMRPITVNQCHR
ncbi:hypothetical protein AGR1A_pAt20505 [Agrobacterium fabacearum CFBP 5771]|nr:hypothetical protein AGR1A_pAt20505 [Agrobacterium fabacearum CFBP 5771]